MKENKCMIQIQKTFPTHLTQLMAMASYTQGKVFKSMREREKLKCKIQPNKSNPGALSQQVSPCVTLIGSPRLRQIYGPRRKKKKKKSGCPGTLVSNDFFAENEIQIGELGEDRQGFFCFLCKQCAVSSGCWCVILQISCGVVMSLS